MALAEAAAPIHHRDPAAIEKAVRALTAAFGNRVVTSQAVREQHGNTVTWIPNQPPDAVVFPQTTEDVQQIVRICAGQRRADHSVRRRHLARGPRQRAARRRLDRLPRHEQGAGGARRGSRLRRSSPASRARRSTSICATSGLFFPIDPGADASLGGMAATRCSGTNAVRYGTMKDNVLALKVVMANGEVMTTARRAKKTSAGYDLTRLMVGSEGTLGVITELTLKLSGIPEAISGGICPFPSVEACCNAAILTIQSGIPVARIELLDALQVKAVNLYSKLGAAGNADAVPRIPRHAKPRSPSSPSASARSPRSSAAARSNGRRGRRSAPGSGRRATTPRCRNFTLRPARRCSRPMSACRSRGWPNASPRRSATSRKAGIVAPIVGHVGDGNFHLTLLVDMDDADEVKRAKGLSERLVERALAMDGTCTGEHGVGQGKMKYLLAEHGAAALDVMAAIKRALDPQNIMNPGKIVALS